MSPKRSKILLYKEESLNEALLAIRRDKLTMGQASKKFHVPKTTIYDHLKKPSQNQLRIGRQPTLTSIEEQKLVKWCCDIAKCGFPITLSYLQNTVSKIVEKEQRQNPFKNNRPGRKWATGFLKRHPEISLRIPETLSKCRASISEKDIRNWFTNLKEYLTTNNHEDILLDPSRIFNGDESSFSLCPKSGKVIAPRGWRDVYEITRGNEKEAITALLVLSAAGEVLPPLVVFPYVRIPVDVVNSAPSEWILGRSDSGWMRTETFYEYLANGFNVWLNQKRVKRPIVLFVDGHKSHLTIDVSEFCEKNSIILYALPPNTTHMMQPADVSVFKPLKYEWKSTVKNWQQSQLNTNAILTKSTFCPLLHSVLEKINLCDAIQNGFRKCGLFPFNPDAVDYSKCIRDTIANFSSAPSTAIEESSILEQPPSEHLSLEKPSSVAFDHAEKVIKYIESRLTQHNIDTNLILQEIRKANTTENNVPALIVESLANLPVGTYDLDFDGNLLMNPSGGEADLNLSSRKVCENIHSSPRQLNNDASTSVYQPNETCKKDSNQMPTSSNIEKHLPFPNEEIFKSKRKRLSRVSSTNSYPFAISSGTYREIFKKKQSEKFKKQEEIQKRKEERLKRKSISHK